MFREGALSDCQSHPPPLLIKCSRCTQVLSLSPCPAVHLGFHKDPLKGRRMNEGKWPLWGLLYPVTEDPAHEPWAGTLGQLREFVLCVGPEAPRRWRAL